MQQQQWQQQLQCQQQLTATRQLLFALPRRDNLHTAGVVHCQCLASVSTWGAPCGQQRWRGVHPCRIGSSVSDLLATKLFHLPIKMYETARRKFKHFIAFFVTPLLHHAPCSTSPCPTCHAPRPHTLAHMPHGPLLRPFGAFAYLFSMFTIANR